MPKYKVETEVRGRAQGSRTYILEAATAEAAEELVGDGEFNYDLMEESIHDTEWHDENTLSVTEIKE